MSTLSLVLALFFSSFYPSFDEDTVVIARSDTLDSLIFNHRSNEAEKFYAADFILTTPTGRKKTKSDMLKDIANEQIIWKINRTTQIEVRTLGKTAVLTGVLHQKGKFGDKDFDMKFQVTDTWVQQNKKWVLLAGHATTLTK